MPTKMNKIILQNKDVRMVQVKDMLDNSTYHVDLYFKDDETWRTIRAGNFYYCHELYKLLLYKSLIRNW